MRYDVLVIGAGPAGTRAALRAAELGATVAVAESGALDGMCVNTGCVPTRVLAKTARIIREIRGAAAYGIDVADPAVVWERTVARSRQVVSAVQASKDTAGLLRRAGVDLYREGRARFVDRHAVELADGGRRLEADKVILCVGGHSRRLQIPGAELAVLPEHVLDLPAVPRRVAIVGGGATGVQLGTIFDALGSAVTLLERRARIMPDADSDVSRLLEASFRSGGIDVRTGSPARQPLRRDRVKSGSSTTAPRRDLPRSPRTP